MTAWIGVRAFTPMTERRSPAVTAATMVRAGVVAALIGTGMSPAPAIAEPMSSNHGIPIPQLLVLKLSNDLQLETDLTFVRQ